MKKMNTICIAQWRWVTPFLLLLAVAALATPASAQDVLSGHVGVAFPLVSHTSATDGSTTTTIADSFNIVFPFGIGVRPPGSPVVLDFEFVPEVHPSTRSVTLLVHPGVIKPLPDGWAIGVRAAFEVNQSSLGFTPLVNKSFAIPHSTKVRWFVEGDLPVRFSQLSPGNNATSVGFNIHLGLGF
jgi:hypothetical protein